MDAFVGGMPFETSIPKNYLESFVDSSLDTLLHTIYMTTTTRECLAQD